MLSLIAKPEASPGPKEATASSPDHQPSRACLGLGRQQLGRAQQGTVPQGFHCATQLWLYMYCFILTQGRKEGCSVAWTMLTAAKPCPAAPAREYGINNIYVQGLVPSGDRGQDAPADPPLHTVTHSCNPGPSQDRAAGASITGRQGCHLPRLHALDTATA